MHTRRNNLRSSLDPLSMALTTTRALSSNIKVYWYIIYANPNTKHSKCYMPQTESSSMGLPSWFFLSALSVGGNAGQRPGRQTELELLQAMLLPASSN